MKPIAQGYQKGFRTIIVTEPATSIDCSEAFAQRPIDDVTKRGSRSGDDHDVASSAIEKIFNSFQFVPRQLFTEPNDARPHERSALRTSRNAVLVLVPIIVPFKFAARTARDEDVAVNSHHPLCRYSSARVQIVHVLRNEQELIRPLGKSCDCFVRSVRSRIADALPPFAIPVPN